MLNVAKPHGGYLCHPHEIDSGLDGKGGDNLMVVRLRCTPTTTQAWGLGVVPGLGLAHRCCNAVVRWEMVGGRICKSPRAGYQCLGNAPRS